MFGTLYTLKRSPSSWRLAIIGASLTALALCPAQSLAVGQGDDDIQHIARELAVDAGRVVPSPVAGLYEIVVGTDFIYVTPDARFLISGDIIESVSGANVSEARRKQLRSEIATRASRTVEPLVFSSAAKRRSITVFIDVDCTLCRKLHADIQALLARGIEVHYVFYPSGTEDSESWKKTKAVWCAKDRHSALNAAMQGRSPTAPAGCDSTAMLAMLHAHRKLGDSLGIQGTPTILDGEGRLILGYRSPEILEATLGLNAARADLKETRIQ